MPLLKIRIVGTPSGEVDAGGVCILELGQTGVRTAISRKLTIRNTTPVASTIALSVTSFPSSEQAGDRSGPFAVPVSASTRLARSGKTVTTLASATSSRMLGSTTSKLSSYNPPASAAGQTRSFTQMASKQVSSLSLVVF